MRTIETTLYHYNELTPEAQERAREWYRNCADDGYLWRESRDSLDQFLSEFNADFRRGNQYSIRVNGGYAMECDISEMSYVRLWKYLQNNHGEVIRKIGNCQFTGACWDECLLDGIAEFMRKPYRTDFESLLYSCCEDLRIAVEAEIDYQNSGEAIAESILANEYEFNDHGEIA